jgi:hypothetical protein
MVAEAEAEPFSPEEARDARDSSGMGDNGAGSMARNDLIDEAKKIRESGDDNDNENLDEAIDSINEGTEPESKGAKDIYKNLQDKYQKMLESIKNLIKKLLGKDVKFDITKKASDQPQETQEAVKELIDRITKEGDADVVTKLQDTLRELLKSDKVTRSSSKTELIMKGLKILAMLAPSIIYGVFGFLVLGQMSENKSGCYVSKPLVLEDKKLSCNGSDKKIIKACNCPDATTKLTMCNVIKKQTCDDGYIYSYEKYSWIDALYDLINGLIEAAAAGAEGGLNILKFLTKYGLYVALFVLLIQQAKQKAKDKGKIYSKKHIRMVTERQAVKLAQTSLMGMQVEVSLHHT